MPVDLYLAPHLLVIFRAWGAAFQIASSDTGRAIAPYLYFIALKTSCDCLAMMRIGWHNIDSMDDIFSVIHADMALHAKIPMIVFFGLMHLRINFPVVILC